MKPSLERRWRTFYSLVQETKERKNSNQDVTENTFARKLLSFEEYFRKYDKEVQKKEAKEREEKISFFKTLQHFNNPSNNCSIQMNDLKKQIKKTQIKAENCLIALNLKKNQ